MAMVDFGELFQKRRWQVRYSKKKLKSNKEVLLLYRYKNGVISDEI